MIGGKDGVHMSGEKDAAVGVRANTKVKVLAALGLSLAAVGGDAIFRRRIYQAERAGER